MIPFLCFACGQRVTILRGSRARHAAGRLGHTPGPVRVFMLALVRRTGYPFMAWQKVGW